MALLDPEFKKAVYFKTFQEPFSASYDGAAEDITRYRIESGSGNAWLLAAEMISVEEKELWDSFKQMLAFSLKTAEASLFGSFEFSLITAGDPEKLRLFQPAGLAQLLVNHGRALKDGETKLLHYASSWSIFRKLAPGDWGKIALKERMMVVKDRARLDLIFKRMVQAALEVEGPVWIAAHDFGRSPIFRFGEEDQTSRLAKFLEKNKSLLGNKIPMIALHQGGDYTDLAAQFGVENPG